MENARTILHIQGATPESVEAALTAIFTNEDRPSVLRLEGTYRLVLARVTAPEPDAAYRYLICQPHPSSAWVPLLELGNRTDGLDAELSRALDGTAVVTTFVYDDGLSGYRVARAGSLLDRYQSDPTYYAADPLTTEEIEAQRGDPARFADLLPAGTTPEDFARVVLRPGWWEEYDTAHDAADDANHDAAAADARDDSADESDEADDELLDEVDRMRCIALALELWGPSEYPFAQELDDLENKVVGPVIALAYT